MKLSREVRAIKDALKMLRDYDEALMIEADKITPNFTIHQKITPIIHRLRKIELFPSVPINEEEVEKIFFKYANQENDYGNLFLSKSNFEKAIKQLLT